MKIGKPVRDAAIGSVVWYLPLEINKSYRGTPTTNTLVYITKGEWEYADRLSNFWYWKEVNKDGTLGKSGCGYGNFYEAPGVKVITNVKIILPKTKKATKPSRRKRKAKV